MVAQMLAWPKVVGQVVGTLLEPDHFFEAPMRVLYDEIVTSYYADEATDALSIANGCARTLCRQWDCDEVEVVARVQALAQQPKRGDAVDHARLVKRKADYRQLASLGLQLAADAAEEAEDPDALAGDASHLAMQIATSGLLTHEILDFSTVGRRYIKEQRKQMAARAAGVEIGVYFGLSFIDRYLRGLRPSELWILGGEPGAGKSACAWSAARLFAERQADVAKDQQIGTLILCLEMAEEPSSGRIAQGIAEIDGGKLREGRTTEAELAELGKAWGRRRNIPLYFNYASTMRATQLRALVVEAIRKYNVGLVVIDHFRYLQMDGRYRSTLEEEEALAKFLKQDVATQLDVAVICLAHTTKAQQEDGRPRLSNLRGGQLVAGHADWVSFIFRPFMYATPKQIESAEVKRTDAEMIYAKTRHSGEGTARFYFDPGKMQIH